ncbi:hypothetical protein BDZ94DRAFT_594837 [Collybia nuda]|uniref:Uncharacterized protein n=1 Tax=Collybia nuda TaxID=64659 RepID=A0A9P5Y9B2_9AGAR|nr:hypothetical protein BDZ94DRAFT_594837 [Collybia nuda]
MDSQLASEMVVLLGRELKVVRKRVEDLEQELTEEKSAHRVDKERAEVAEQTNATLILDVEKFGRENRALWDEMKSTRRMKQQEEDQEVKIKEPGEVGGRAAEVDEKAKASTILQQELENLRAERTVFQEAEANWLKSHDELTKRIDFLALENQELLRRFHERLGDGAATHEDGEIAEEAGGDIYAQSEYGDVFNEGEGEEEELEATPAIRNYVSGFPMFGGLPQNRLTSPVADANRRPGSYLISHVGFKNFLYISAGRIRWYSGKTHAITCSPSFILKKKYWEEHSPFSDFFGTTREVFFARGSAVYYAGTYKCHQPPEFLPQTIALPGDLSVAATIDALRIPYSFKEDWVDKATLQQLFRHGILQTDYLIIECVGFNHRLFRQKARISIEPKEETKE